MTDDAKDLAREVAEEVMGWRQIKTKASTYGGLVPHNHWYLAATPDPQGDGYWTHHKTADEYPRHSHSEHWHPDTDISDAWLVIEKMRERGYSYTLYEFDGKHYCRFTLTDEERGAIHTKSAAESICRAALAAVRGGG